MNNETYNSFGQLSIVDLIDFVRRYFKLVLVTTLAAIAFALAYIFTATSLYTAAGRLLIDGRVPYLAQEQWRETGMVLDSPQIESQIAVLRSEPVAQAVVRRLALRNDPEFNPAGASLTTSSGPAKQGPQFAQASTETGDTTTERSSAEAEPDPEALRDIAARVQIGLGIRRVGFSYVLEILYTSPDPEKAARLANGFMQAYIDDQIATRTEMARQGSEWLERRINSLRLQMNQASLKVQEFKARRDYSIMGSNTTEANAAPRKGLTETLDELEATALTYRKMFESALQAFTEVEQRQSYHASSARIIATATPPLARSSPKRKQTLAVAMAIGIMLGLGIGLLREGYYFARAAASKRNDRSV